EQMTAMECPGAGGVEAGIGSGLHGRKEEVDKKPTQAGPSVGSTRVRLPDLVDASADRAVVMVLHYRAIALAVGPEERARVLFLAAAPQVLGKLVRGDVCHILFGKMDGDVAVGVFGEFHSWRKKRS